MAGASLGHLDAKVYGVAGSGAANSSLLSSRRPEAHTASRRAVVLTTVRAPVGCAGVIPAVRPLSLTHPGSGCSAPLGQTSSLSDSMGQAGPGRAGQAGRAGRAGRAAGYDRRGQRRCDRCAAPTDVNCPWGRVPGRDVSPSAGESATSTPPGRTPAGRARPHCAGQSQVRARRPPAHAPAIFRPQFVSARAPRSGRPGHCRREQSVPPGGDVRAGRAPAAPST
jgi:hypothetical protein